MMKFPRTTAAATAAAFVATALAATVHAAPAVTITSLDSWQAANLHDVTQAWYYTGETLAATAADGAPWAADRQVFKPADAALAPPPAPAVPAKVEVPPSLPEPPMASMLLVGVVLIFLRIGRKDDLLR